MGLQLVDQFHGISAMPKYGLPGLSVDKRRSTRIGLAAACLVALLVVALFVVDRLRGDDRLQVVLRTEQIGDGIVDGTQVRLDGVAVGEIETIENAADGQQLITLRLNQAQLFGVTDTLDVDYAPSNLFGISEIELRRGSGGTPLQNADLIDLTGANAERVQDVTMGNLLRAVTRTATDVLTPELTDTLTSLASDLEAFTPLLEAIVTTGRNVADTQRYAASFLLGQFGSALTGAAPMVGGTIQLLDTLTNLEILKTDRAKFDQVLQITIQQLFPGISDLLFTAENYFAGYADMLPPALDAAARMVPTPQLSSTQLRELLDRLDASFTDTPDGPMLDLALDLRGVPALSVPLLGANPLLGGER
ncbi:mammalian cell entry protein [Antrihabitans sp. YC3-6]|uniref:Mammalian cell entry protein n=1 Tax=Antrihabitans stalagmiti TaxID=2799499 RepID=A0A934NVS4_9NOCA|nr:mammalian cell entry protein [Antrihabitans stalagmiti]MBJ8342127.1 mammalian cell entry protein [Antrihabitans stalagmiti]